VKIPVFYLFLTVPAGHFATFLGLIAHILTPDFKIKTIKICLLPVIDGKSVEMMEQLRMHLYKKLPFVHTQ